MLSFARVLNTALNNTVDFACKRNCYISMKHISILNSFIPLLPRLVRVFYCWYIYIFGNLSFSQWSLPTVNIYLTLLLYLRGLIKNIWQDLGCWFFSQISLMEFLVRFSAFFLSFLNRGQLLWFWTAVFWKVPY